MDNQPRILVHRGPCPSPKAPTQCKEVEHVPLKRSRLDRLLLFLDKPGANLFVYLLIAAMLALAIIAYAILSRPARYTYHSSSGAVFDTHTGKVSASCDAPPIWPERRK